jgi:hypothetical protein
MTALGGHRSYNYVCDIGASLIYNLADCVKARAWIGSDSQISHIERHTCRLNV